MNTTGLAAGLAVVADAEARDHCVVVAKGTYATDSRGDMVLARHQCPPVETDEHHGDPETSSVLHENDFVLRKRFTDVLVVGRAVAPPGRATRRIAVRLEVEGKAKDAVVYGDRRWIAVGPSLSPSEPAHFSEVPLMWERAFGGQDDSRGKTDVAVELRNPCGVGYHPHRGVFDVVGSPVPNIERPGEEVTSPRKRVEPVGFGCVGRAWAQRVRFAGTYDARWLDEHAPFLPPDFDERYYQCAPEDQWFPLFRGGEVIRCVNMATSPVVTYRIPRLEIPCRFRFSNRVELRRGNLDTVILEPHLARAQLVWRMSVPLTKKLTDLRTIELGEQPDALRDGIVGYRNGKPVIAGVAATLRWLRHISRR